MNAPHFRRFPSQDPDPGQVLALLELGTEDEARSPAPGSRPPSPGGLSATADSLDGVHQALRARPSERASAPLERRVGPYFLVDRLGRGSQAEVWKAIRVTPKLAPVALRMLPPEHARVASRRDAFLRAARLSRRLPSPPWLPTLDFGEADGCVYQTMPLIEGGTLADAIATRRLGPPSAPRTADAWWQDPDEPAYLEAIVRLMAQVARALAVAHDRRVVHRDVKPENLLLDRSRRDTVFLADLGIGRELGEEAAPAPAGLVGTLMYMAPERLRNEPADERLADIYSLGVTMYEALTLVHPWQVPEGMPRSCLATYVSSNTVPRLRLFRPELPKSLESIVLRALAPEPGQRYPSASALARALERFIWGTADTASAPPGKPERHPFPTRSHLFRNRAGQVRSPAEATGFAASECQSARPRPSGDRAPARRLQTWIRRTISGSRLARHCGIARDLQ